MSILGKLMHVLAAATLSPVLDKGRALLASRGRTRGCSGMFAIALLTGCTGYVGSAGSAASGRFGAGGASDAALGTSAGGAGAQTPSAVFSDLPDTPFAPAPGGLKRLTVAQYLRTVEDLLGPGLNLPTNLEPDALVDGFTAIGATEVPLSSTGIEQYDEAARSLAGQVFASGPRRQTFVGCVPARATDDCARSFIGRFGARAWRRPLEPDELERYLALHKSVSTSLADPWKGLEYAVAAFLESPFFLHRVELGQPDPERPGLARFDDYEMGSRVAYFLWGTTPDDQLFTAAENGGLKTDAGLRAQVARLLASPRVQSNLLSFFAEHFVLTSLETLSREPSLYPNATPSLGLAMRGEWERVVADYAFNPSGDFREVLTAPDTYVNTELASLYGLTAPAAGFTKVALPASQRRAGVLSLSGLLAATAHPNRSSPTARGVFLRRKLLCQVVGPPPPGVVVAIESDPAKPNTTLRKRLEAHRTNPACAGCHANFDPIGLGLENYDALGAYRELEDGQPVDASGSIDGIDFIGAAALGKILRDDRRFSDCLARHLYSQAVGHAVTPGEGQTVKTLAQGFDTSGHVFDLLTSIILSNGFRLASSVR